MGYPPNEVQPVVINVIAYLLKQNLLPSTTVLGSCAVTHLFSPNHDHMTARPQLLQPRQSPHEAVKAAVGLEIASHKGDHFIAKAKTMIAALQPDRGIRIGSDGLGIDAFVDDFNPVSEFSWCC